MIISGVYAITNITTGKRYIGSSIDCLERFKRHRWELRAGRHVNPVLQNAFNKYGEDDFTYKVIHPLPITDAQDKEQWYIDNFYEELYNTSRSAYHGGDLITYHPNRDDIVLRMTEAVKLRYQQMSPEERKLLSERTSGQNNGMFGRKHSPEAIQQMSLAASARTGEKNPFYGRTHSEQTRQKISEFASTRTGEKNPFYGKSHSDEFKESLRQKFKGRIPTNARPVVIDEVEYVSATEAARQLGVVTATILHRIKSRNEKYKGYFYQ
jgi:group I intron endonuclease